MVDFVIGVIEIVGLRYIHSERERKEREACGGSKKDLRC